MLKINVLLLVFGVYQVFSQGVGSGSNGNLRVCVVESKGPSKRVSKYCPVLDKENSGVECVLGTDSLDCLRRMSKGTVDFGAFYPEDLIAAQWAKLDVLVASELRSRNRQFEQSIVAVVSRRIQPEGSSSARAILRNTTLCHPGLRADDRGLSDTLAQYLEQLVIDRSCNASLSLTENRLLGLSTYFGKACRPGEWVPDPSLDDLLKSRYPSLCTACQSGRCSKSDGYYGDTGALTCLTNGGDVTWSELHTAQAYFGLLPGTEAFAPAVEYAFLCRDGSWQPLNTTSPCQWLQRPWRVLAAKTKSAEAVTSLAMSLTNDTITTDCHWHGTLAKLLEINQAQQDPLRPQKTPMDYLASAVGFREAYSQAGCTPSRHITICTSSLLEQNKCEWLSEAGSVYGIQPALQCARRETREACFEAVGGQVDVTVADSDWLVAAQRDYPVVPLLHEVTPIVEQTRNVVAYVRKDAQIYKMADLRGKRAAFPLFDGYAWHSVAEYLSSNKNECRNNIVSYFSEICAPGVEKFNVSNEIKERLTKSCSNGEEEGEMKALKALIEGNTDVAFISMSTFKKYSEKIIPRSWAQIDVEIIPICPPESKSYCFVSWSSLGHVYIAKNTTEQRQEEYISVFENLDQLFGKNPMFHTPMFVMYGLYNDKQDVMFHTNTKKLSTNDVLNTHPYDKVPLSFERSLKNFKFQSCGVNYLNNSKTVNASFVMVLALTMIVLYGSIKASIVR